MLTSFACSCVRSSRIISVPFAKLSVLSAGKISPRSLTLTAREDLSPHRACRPLAPALWQQHRGLSRSAAVCGDADPLSSPSAPQDDENFGSLSADMSSRRLFRKSRPHTQDLLHQEDDATEEEDAFKARRRPGGRNTPYWYFLQCKKLIRENKVVLETQRNTCRCLSL